MVTGASGPYIPHSAEYKNQDGPNSVAGCIEHMMVRFQTIMFALSQTCLLNPKSIEEAADIIARCIDENAIMRILGAGRALAAGIMPGNRLAHAGAQVSFMGGIVPMPNTICGGYVIALSASGQTPPVLEAMRLAKANNPEIKVIGIASHTAKEFESLCDVFIGIHIPKEEYPNPLSALADTEEYVISELFDALVVLAGKKLGFDDNRWRQGHEDLGATGPYSPISIDAHTG